MSIIDFINTAAAEDTETTGPLDPCPHCGSRPHQAPEGIHDVHSVRHHPGAEVGAAKWNFEHCWKCGYRPGTNVAVSDAAMRRAFEQFKSMYDSHLKGLAQSDPRASLPGASNTELTEAQAEIAELQRQLAVLNAEKDKENDGSSGQSS